MLFNAMLFALASAVGDDVTGPPPILPMVLLGPGDSFYAGTSSTPIVVGAGKYLLRSFTTVDRIVTAASVVGGSINKVVPATIFFGDGHVLVLMGGTTVKGMKVPLNSDARAAVELVTGAITLADTDYSSATLYQMTKQTLAQIAAHKKPAGHGLDHVQALSTKIIVKTTSATTGAKGCLLTIMHYPAGPSYLASIYNYETNDCQVSRKDDLSNSSPLPRGNMMLVPYAPATTPLPAYSPIPAQPNHSLATPKRRTAKPAPHRRHP